MSVVWRIQELKHTVILNREKGQVCSSVNHNIAPLPVTQSSLGEEHSTFFTRCGDVGGQANGQTLSSSDENCAHTINQFVTGRPDIYQVVM